MRVLPARDNGQRRIDEGEEAKAHPEQIIRKLREAEQMLSEEKTTGEVAKALGVSEQTFHRWRKQYGGMKASDAKRLRELERENGQLKRLVADKVLEVLTFRRSPRTGKRVQRILARGGAARARQDQEAPSPW